LVDTIRSSEGEFFERGVALYDVKLDSTTIQDYGPEFHGKPAHFFAEFQAGAGTDVHVSLAR
jgi:hypothetical protein